MHICVAVLALSRTAPPPEPEPDAGEGLRTVVTDERGDGLDDQRDLDARTPGFATAVDVRHEAGARPGDAVPELIARTPGASVRSLGGLGQFAAVSVRGSSALQIPLFVDGAPVSSGFAGLDDLSARLADDTEDNS